MANISLILWWRLTYERNKSYLLKLENNEEPAVYQEALVRPVVGHNRTLHELNYHFPGFCFELVRTHVASLEVPFWLFSESLLSSLSGSD